MIENPNENATKFIERMHTELENDYRYRGKKYVDLCAAIAYVAGKKLLREGCFPTIEKIVASYQEDKKLIPIRFGGRVRWDAHFVCVCNQHAFDPVIGRIEPCTTYTIKMFGEKLDLNPFRTTDEIVRYGDERIFLDFS